MKKIQLNIEQVSKLYSALPDINVWMQARPIGDKVGIAVDGEFNVVYVANISGDDKIKLAQRRLEKSFKDNEKYISTQL